MGVEQTPQTQPLTWNNLFAGWYPGREHSQIPREGASDCDHVVWIEGALRKVFGFDNVNTAALQGGASVVGMIDFTGDNNNLVGVVGTRVYEQLQSDPPTLLAGVVLTNNLQCRLTEFRAEGVNMVIGVNGTDVPWSFDGTTLQNLAGSPPTGQWIAQYGTRVYIARHTGFANRLYYSDFGTPTIWDTANNFLVMDAPITGLGVLGTQLVVFKERSIAVVTGTQVENFAVNHSYVPDVGCVSGHTVVNVRLGGPNGQEVLIFLAQDGIYAFDGSRTVKKLSGPMERKWKSVSSTTRWNTTRFANAVATYWDRYDWYVLSLSDGGDSINDFVLCGDVTRPYQTPDQELAIPWWPMDGTSINAISTRMNSGNQDTYFGDTTGFVYRFDPSIFNENGVAYNGTWTSRIEDLQQHVIVREVAGMFDESADTDVDVFVNMDLATGLGTQGTINLQETADLLNTTFILNTSQLGGRDFTYASANIEEDGRFLQWTVRNNVLNESFVLEQMDIVVTSTGRRWVQS